MEHEFYTGLSLFAMAAYTIKKFGPDVAAYLDKEVEKDDAAMNEGRKSAIDAATQGIASEKEEQERARAALMLIEAKKENVALQLEAAYRANLVQVYNEVLFTQFVNIL